MANQPLFSAATNREPNQENTGGITPARMSYNTEEDDRLGFDEPTSQEK
jgi:hypothetical protein